MKNISVNSQINITYPDSFNLMDSEELKKSFITSTNDRWAIHDKENHAIISIAWQRAGLAGSLADIRAVAKNNEKRVEQIYSDKNYKLAGFSERKIGGKKAAGYKYSYTIENVDQYTSVYLLKHGGYIYAIAYTGRIDEFEEFEKILDGIELK